MVVPGGALTPEFFYDGKELNYVGGQRVVGGDECRVGLVTVLVSDIGQVKTITFREGEAGDEDEKKPG